MSSLKIALKINRHPESKIKLKLEIVTNSVNPKCANGWTWPNKKMTEPSPDESLPLFDCPEEIMGYSEQSSFWKNIPNWFKFWHRR